MPLESTARRPHIHTTRARAHSLTNVGEPQTEQRATNEPKTHKRKRHASRPTDLHSLARVASHKPGDKVEGAPARDPSTHDTGRRSRHSTVNTTAKSLCVDTLQRTTPSQRIYGKERAHAWRGTLGPRLDSPSQLPSSVRLAARVAVCIMGVRDCARSSAGSWTG